MDESTRLELAAVQQRVARLEWERWAWRIGVGAIAAGLLLPGAAAPSPVTEEVRTEGWSWLTPRVVLRATELKPVRTEVTQRRPESSLVLFGAGGPVLWKAP